MVRLKRLWRIRGRASLLAIAVGALLCAWSLQPVAAAGALTPRDPTPTATIPATATAADTTTPTASATAAIFLPAGVTAPPAPSLTAKAAELYDVTTGQTLLSLAPDTSLPMASTTKIMTAVVALTYGNLNQMITVGPDAYAIEFDGTSVAGLRLGEKLTLKDMLYCLMLPSGDDAAVAIADGIAGSQDHFVALMNLEAGLLGLGDTHYANPHGLDEPGHYTSASDLIRLAEFALQSPTFAQIVQTAKITLPATATHHAFHLVNTNELLPGEPFAYDGAIGVKTGYTGGAGYCLVFLVKRPAGTLLGVVLGEPIESKRFTDPTTLLNWGYALLSPTPTPTATSAASPTAAASATATTAP